MGVEFTPRPAKPTPVLDLDELKAENEALKKQVELLQQANDENAAVLDALLGVKEGEAADE